MRSARSIGVLCGCLLILVSLSIPVHARPEPDSLAARQTDAELLDRLQRAAGGQLRVARHARTGRLRFLGTAPARPVAAPRQLAASAAPVQVARAFLDAYGPLFGVSAQANELLLTSSQAGAGGQDFVRFQQRYQGVPILGAELIVQTGPSNTVAAVSGELLPESDLDVRPRVTAAGAEQEALAGTARDYDVDQHQLVAAAPALWIYDARILGGPGLHRPALVWRTEVTSRVDPLLRELVLVDAQLGSVTLAFNQVSDARERHICDDKNLGDIDTIPDNNCDGAPPSEYVRSEGGAATGIADVDRAYDFSGDTYDFYFDRFGRDSLDGQGLPLRSIVRYCPAGFGCPYDNAGWNGQVMIYGDGYASADDVVAHELTHGVTDFTSRLFYYYQSGAINESLSDVFGELIDLANGSGTDTPAVRWLLGEDLPAAIGAIRDMKDPPSMDDPDRTSSPLYTADLDEEDRGGVHVNSGVNNKAAFLLTDGGTFNGKTVQALGIDKVARLYYEVETHLLTSAADYQDLASALLQACQNLVGQGGITATDCLQVTAATDATEMSLQPPAAQAPEAPVCPAGLASNAFWSDDLETPGAGRWVAQTLYLTNTWYYPPTANSFGFDATYATSGSMNLWGYDRNGTSDSAMAMAAPVALPAGAWLRFNHAYGFDDNMAGAYDGGVVEYSIDNGSSWVDASALFADNGYPGTIASGTSNPLGGRQAFVRESNGYYSSRLDLQSLAGQSVRFRFRIGTNGAGFDLGWFIDDVQLYTCGAVPTPTPSPTPVPTVIPTPPPNGGRERTFVPLVDG